MRILRLLVIPALALTLNVVVSAAGPIGMTHAQAPNFDFNAFNWYCTTGSSMCNPANVEVSGPYGRGYFCSDGYDTCAGLNYGAVQVSGSIYGTSGMPGLVTLSCENFTGRGEFNAGYVNVSTAAFESQYGGSPWLYYFSHGAWSGDSSAIMAGSKATIIGGGNETSNVATSSIQATAYDAYWGTIGSVTGTQYTSDYGAYQDTPVNGGLTITIRSVASQFNGSDGGYGLAHFTTGFSTDFATVDYYYQGTITCHVSGAMATAIGDALAGYYDNGYPQENGWYGAEAELGEYPLKEYNDNCAYAPIIIDDPIVNNCYQGLS